MTIKLRPYQEEALEVMKNTKEGEPSLIVLPTGSGKGTLFAALANQANGRVLVVVPSGELLLQGIEKIRQLNIGANVGKIQANINQLEAKILCGTRQSLTHIKSTRIEKMLQHGEIEYVILDEAHLAVDKLKSIIKKMKNTKVIGMTATPFNPRMNMIFKEINYEKSILDMIMEGYLCEPRAIMVSSKTDLSKIKMVAGDFKQDELENAVNTVERNQLIVQSYKEYASERKATIIFCTGIDHCNSLLEEFRLEGYECDSIDSNMSKESRDSALSKFESGKIKILLNVNILSTGYDLPKIDCVILAKPTRSRIFFTQAIGRGLRIYPEKVDALIVDISDNCRSHDLMSLSNIFDIKIKHGETPSNAKSRIKKEKDDEEKRKREEEERRIEREKVKQQEMKIRVEQIKLFNRDMTNRFYESKLDWFKTNNITYALTISMTGHYTIENVNDTYFLFYVSTNKENKYAEFKQVNENLTELIKCAEKDIGKNSFTDKYSDWKKHDASDKQRQFANFAKTKWDAHIFFSSNTINSILKKWKLENANNNEEAVV
jgi:superfamily II DNA or RNA helicase